MADGRGCRCAARCEAECGCRDADWTRQDLIDARAEIERLRGEADKLRQRLRLADAAVRSETHWTLTDAEREAIETACVSLERDDRFYENEAASLRATLERLLERLK